MRWDETWHRLRDWTNGQGVSERLAAQVLLSEGFTELDPSHPLGGPDGRKDAVALKHGRHWLMAVYFPRGQHSFPEIRAKFVVDLAGVESIGAQGFAFVTNQELTLGERSDLAEISAPVPTELYHLERVVAVLDQPSLREVRDQFLGIYDLAAVMGEVVGAAVKQVIDLQTGGDSLCYCMLYHFDMAAAVAHQLAVIRQGVLPLYDLRVRIYDLDNRRDVIHESWGELNGPAGVKLVSWPLPDSVYYRIFFHARNGDWMQDLQLRRSGQVECWLAATIVKRQGVEVFQHIDQGFDSEFGVPIWRA